MAWHGTATAAARRVGAVVGVLVVAAGCTETREAGRDDTIPRITAGPTSSTSAAPEQATTAAPTSAPATTVPVPTQPTTPVTVAPTTPTTTPGPTSAVVLTPGEQAECSAEGIGADTGLVVAGVSCRGGWAIGQVDGCPQSEACEDADVFHYSEAGWVHDGTFSVQCPETLAEAGMTIYTAMAFVPDLCGDDPPSATNILPGSGGDEVTQLQTALVALGYDLAIDGRYGPRTEASVRDFQARSALEVDGIAGPRTQEALGVGPGAAPATPGPGGASTGAGTAEGSSTATPGTTVAVTPGDPVDCTADAVSAAPGPPVDRVECRAGWAIAPRPCEEGEANCPRAHVFHLTDTGWEYDGQHSTTCVDDLTVTGMSVHVAAEFAELCADALPARENILPGSTSPQVEQVQIALVALGYPLDVDGTYGPRTEAAVRDFQAANDLEVDGIAGPDTQTALGI